MTAVTNFGLFVQLDALLIDGLVHVTSLKRDYYQYDQAHHRLVGERTGRCYQLGDRLEVVIVRVDMEERKIDFDLAGSDAGRYKSEDGRKGRKDKPRKKDRKRKKDKSGKKDRKQSKARTRS